MSERRAVCIIPARLESTRLPRKLLKTIGGKPLIQWVYEQARHAKKIARVLVACDHELIQKTVESFGGEAVLTSRDHKSGTERIAEAAKHLTADYIVNVQGDEPLMNPEVIDLVVDAFSGDLSCVMTTACVKQTDPADFRNPNVVKVVKDKNGVALYFSRAPIPCDRDGSHGEYFKHLGIYGYRREFLLEIPSLPNSCLEDREKLEQLKILEHGYRIRVVETVHDSIGVDTEEDLERVKQRLSERAREGATHA